MKRFTCILLGAVLAVSSAAFTGCNEKRNTSMSMPWFLTIWEMM